MAQHRKTMDRSRDRLWRAAKRGDLDGCKALLGCAVLEIVAAARKGDPESRQWVLEKQRAGDLAGTLLTDA